MTDWLARSRNGVVDFRLDSDPPLMATSVELTRIKEYYAQHRARFTQQTGHFAQQWETKDAGSGSVAVDSGGHIGVLYPVRRWRRYFGVDTGV